MHTRRSSSLGLSGLAQPTHDMTTSVFQVVTLQVVKLMMSKARFAWGNNGL